jgi:hypothetical protein
MWAFGWAGGKILVEQSYSDAKVRVAEQKAQRAEKRAAGGGLRSRLRRHETGRSRHPGN